MLLPYLFLPVSMAAVENADLDDDMEAEVAEKRAAEYVDEDMAGMEYPAKRAKLVGKRAPPTPQPSVAKRAAPKQPKGKAKAKAKAAAAVQIQQGVSLTAQSPNAIAYDSLRRMIKDLVENVDVFGQIHEEKPLPIGMGGREEPYSDSRFKTAFTPVDGQDPAGLEFKCGCNLLWMCMEEEAGPGHDVPLSDKGITKLMDHFFSVPTPFRQDFIIALKNGDELPSSKKGHLMRASPPEPLHACIRAAHRDWKAGKGDEVMNEWRRVFLTATFIFRVIENADDTHFVNLQYRQDTHAAYVGMSYTLVQKIYDIVSFRSRKGGGLSYTQVADAYKASKVTFSGDAEDTHIIGSTMVVLAASLEI